MLTLIIGILIFANFVIYPVLLHLSARILRIKNVGFWRTYLCFLLLTAVSTIAYALNLISFPAAKLFFVSLALGGLALQSMIVCWVFRTTFWRAVGCWFLCLALCVGFALGIRAVAVEAFVVPTGAMSPTVLRGERFLVDKITLHFRELRKGEIIAFHPPQDPNTTYLKRVVATGGDRIEVRNDVAYVNGVASGRCVPGDSSYEVCKGIPSMKFPCTVPPGKLLTLGDNRKYSIDSRHYGFADVQAVVGLAVIIYASVEQPPDPLERRMLLEQGKDPAKNARPGRIRWNRIGAVLKQETLPIEAGDDSN
jgi:signal peptidase I